MKNNRVQSHMRMMRQTTTPLNVPRTMRPHSNPILLRMDPGVAVPIAAAGLFREDAIVKGRLSVAITMDETAEVLLNPVMVRVTAYLVPWLAFDRFAGRDEFEASYSKVPLREGDAVIPSSRSRLGGLLASIRFLTLLAATARPRNRCPPCTSRRTTRSSTIAIVTCRLICPSEPGLTARLRRLFANVGGIRASFRRSMPLRWKAWLMLTLSPGRLCRFMGSALIPVPQPSMLRSRLKKVPATFSITIISSMPKMARVCSYGCLWRNADG